MDIRIISFTQRGARLAEALAAALREKGHAVGTYLGSGPGKVPLRAWTQEAFAASDALIFVGAAGIAVRSVSPYVVSKASDPAVLVADEGGQFVIPILSGHLGGANELAAEAAALLHAVPVITTATDVSGVFAVDSWARRQGLVIVNPERIKWVSARLLAGETVRLRSASPIRGQPPKGVELTEDKEYDVLVSHKTRGRESALRLVPPVCALGVGCRKGIQAEALEEAYDALLRKGSISPAAVQGVFSVDMKSAEPGLLRFCAHHRLPFQTFSARRLNQAPGTFSSSEFVRQVTGTDNVCERSAVCGCGEGGTLIVKKNAGNGVTMALAMPPLNLSF